VQNPACGKKANPGLGTIKSLDILAGKVEKAKKNPLLVKNLVTKDFNVRETASEAWLTFEQLNNTATFDLAVLKPRYGIGGADLSSTVDLTAELSYLWCLMIRIFMFSRCTGSRKTSSKRVNWMTRSRIQHGKRWGCFGPVPAKKSTISM